MNKIDVVNSILKNIKSNTKEKSEVVFAPTNIALSKYWGKRNSELHLPMNSSVSISLEPYGARSQISLIDNDQDTITLNQNTVAPNHSFYKKATAFLDLFRPNTNTHFHVETKSNIPIAAGLASSACGFAALALALNDLFQWQLDNTLLSILARLGSGSASRSIENGFMLWHKGEREDGFDSFAENLNMDWPEFKIGAIMIDDKAKVISSREGMQRTVETASLYKVWPAKAENDCKAIVSAIKEKHFVRLGSRAENNALFMHATMHAATPPVNYWSEQSITTMHQVWQLRDAGLPIYFTMDAGPNIKLLFLEKDRLDVEKHFELALYS